MTVNDLPLVNATLNAIATCFLFAGWVVIKKGNRDLHRKLMVAALACSAAFLACYVYYHAQTGARTPYEREDFTRYIYYTILITHVPLAALMVPFILATVWAAIKENWERHVKINKILWPVWMYVSVTGVLIYLMLYQLQ